MCGSVRRHQGPFHDGHWSRAGLSERARFRALRLTGLLLSSNGRPPGRWNSVSCQSAIYASRPANLAPRMEKRPNWPAGFTALLQGLKRTSEVRDGWLGQRQP